MQAFRRFLNLSVNLQLLSLSELFGSYFKRTKTPNKQKTPQSNKQNNKSPKQTPNKPKVSYGTLISLRCFTSSFQYAVPPFSSIAEPYCFVPLPVD